MTAPAASVVVLAYRSAGTIAAVLRGLQDQDIAEPFEVVVVASGNDATAAIVHRGHPEVLLLHASERLTPGASRNAGVQAAGSAIVAFLADDCIPDPSWLRLRVEAHRSGHLLVGGFVDSAEPSTLAGWAQYFAKFWSLQRLNTTRAEGRGPLFHLSYHRSTLGFRFDESLVAGEDTAFNHALIAAGRRVWFDAAIRVRHLNDRRWRDVLAAQREQGASSGVACREHELDAYYRPSIYGGPWMPLVQWWRAARVVARHRPQLVGRFLLASPLVVAATAVRRNAFRRALDAPLPEPRDLTAEIRVVPGSRRRPSVTAIVPAFNEEASIGDCLDSLLGQSVPDLEVVVVDDGSTDRTAAVARSRGGRVLTLPHSGPAAAKNAGAAVAAGDVLAFVDADLVAEPRCLERLSAPILDGRTVGTFTREIRVANPDNPWADCWTLNRRAIRGEHFPSSFNLERWANFRAVSRAAFLAAGGFDDVGYGEDMTLSPKLGLLAHAVPGAIMLHRHPDSLREVWANARWVGRGVAVRSEPYLARRYNPWRSFKRGLRGARTLGRPRYVLFALAYDLGVLSGHAETRLGNTNHAK